MYACRVACMGGGGPSPPWKALVVTSVCPPPPPPPLQIILKETLVCYHNPLLTIIDNGEVGSYEGRRDTADRGVEGGGASLVLI